MIANSPTASTPPTIRIGGRSVRQPSVDNAASIASATIIGGRYISDT